MWLDAKRENAIIQTDLNGQRPINVPQHILRGMTEYRYSSIVGLRSLSISSGNGNLSVRSASLRPSRANSLSWSATHASFSTASPKATVSSPVSAYSTAEVPPTDFSLRVLRLVATPPNAALGFAFLPSAAATAAAAAEAAMHHHGDSSSSFAMPSTAQSSGASASTSAAAAAPAIEGAAPTLHVNDILSGAPNLQVCIIVIPSYCVLMNRL
jgi:hypothetical protein